MAIPNTKEIAVIQTPELSRAVLLQNESVIHMDLAKPIDSFAQLADVRQHSEYPKSDYCLCDRLFLTRQPDWDWLDMINTFYHSGAKQACEHLPWHNPVQE